MTCEHCGKEFEPRKSGRPQRHCPGGECYEAKRAEDRRLGRELRRRLAASRPAPRDFDDARQEPEFQKGVDEILAWAEDQRPATLEAWGIVKTVKAA